MSEVIAYLGLGTNLGDRWANLRGAAELLAAGARVAGAALLRGV